MHQIAISPNYQQSDQQRLMMPQRQIPPERKRLYYIGMVISGIGLISFLSVFVSAALQFGDFSNFEGRARSAGIRAVAGIIMLMGGGVLMNMGRMGLSGSGFKLDAEEARRDVEPWARTSGGVMKDALDEAGIQLGNKTSAGEVLSIEERLRRLQKLKAEGLINDQEYEITKRKILEEA